MDLQEYAGICRDIQYMKDMQGRAVYARVCKKCNICCICRDAGITRVGNKTGVMIIRPVVLRGRPAHLHDFENPPGCEITPPGYFVPPWSETIPYIRKKTVQKRRIRVFSFGRLYFKCLYFRPSLFSAVFIFGCLCFRPSLFAAVFFAGRLYFWPSFF